MQLVDRFTRLNYDSLEDFYENYKITIPDNFNYAYDVIDEYARLAPDQRAMIWVNDLGEEHIFTFADMARYSNKAANVLVKMGCARATRCCFCSSAAMNTGSSRWASCGIGAIQIPGHPSASEKG